MIAGALALAVIGATPWVMAAASTSTTAAAVPSLAASSDLDGWVTLMTGDRVLVRGTDGKANLLVEQAPRSVPAAIIQYTRRGDRYVVPSDAAGLVHDGIVDEQLFNVTGLVRQGYDDAHTDRVPLLVKSGAAATMKAPAGAAMRRTLPRVGMAALDEKKPQARQFWSGLLASSRKKMKGADGRLQLAGAVQRVWLDQKVHVDLDQSVPQIGAPIAWSHGFTGAGVTVAILDTGIDAKHPDFAGRIGPTEDFSGSGNVGDGVGHGTHVASIVAGSGAASGGKYRGVAPDATLAIGKVFDDSGNGSLDTILAGMQWAATEVHAKVVNMSLGAGPSDGTDPASVALNELTRETGTLFVVSAGNFGADETVSAPGAADAALTVASVSKSDVLSPFSSRGPRLTDGALKPDVSAPGENIVAAMASGVPPIGDPVGDAYQSLSGTSMAAPHVSGSVALLAQEHPDWSADQFKAAMMSTAVQVADAGPYSVGDGRIDVGRATTQSVFATGSVSTFLPWPNQGMTKEQAVTWHNTGATSVTLALSAALTRRDGQPAPAGLIALSATSVTVPAGGDASVTLTVNAQNGAQGEYAGILTAHSADATVATRTALSVNQQAPQWDLTVNLIDRDGNPATDANGVIAIFDLDHEVFFQAFPGVALRLPQGRYAIHSVIDTPIAGQDPSETSIVHPELRLDHDVVQTLDARTGKAVSTAPDDPVARAGQQAVSTLTDNAECGCAFGITVGGDARFVRLYATTVAGTSSPSFTFVQNRQAFQPALELSAQTDKPFEVQAFWTQGPVSGTGTINAVYAGRATPDELAKIDVRGKLVLFDTTPFDPVDTNQQIADIKAAGGKMVLPLFSFGIAATTSASVSALALPSLPVMGVAGATGDRFVAAVKAGGLSVSFVSRQFDQHRYELAHEASGKVDTDQIYQPKTRDLVAVHARYYDNASNVGHLVVARFFARPGLVDSGGLMTVQGARETVEYYTPGSWALHEQTGGLGAREQKVTLQPGQLYNIGWNKAVSGPSLRFPGLFPSFPWAARFGNAMAFDLPLFSDSTGIPREVLNSLNEAAGSISLYRDGSLVGTEPSPNLAFFSVPAEAGSYRLSVDATMTAPWWPLSTKVTATWGFQSGTTATVQILPLLTVRFDPTLDIRNRAPGGTSFTFPAYVERQGNEHPAVASFTVDVSYDDGRTWQPAVVTPVGDHFNVRVNHPAHGYASLRATATDSDGNTVEQTVVRAYAIGE